MPEAAPDHSGSLLRNRSLLGLTLTQFLGAFNDNLFKGLMLLLAARVLFQEDKQWLASGLFALPFVLFSGIAGNVSERFSKRQVIFWMKVAEIGVMSFAVVALALKSWPLLLGTLFVMGTQSAFFGPSKYGIVPEIVERRGLIQANGLILMTTFLAILLGTALAGPLIDRFLDALWVAALVCLALAVLGTATSLLIEVTEPRQPHSVVGRNPFGGLWTTIRVLRAETSVFPIIAINSLFWFNGMVVQQVVNGMGIPEVLGLGDRENRMISWLLAGLAVSLIAGSLLVPIVAKRVPVSRLAVGGAVVMAASQCLLPLVGPVVPPDRGGYALAMAALCCAGVGGAFFAVPLLSFIQDGPRRDMKGKAFAVNNFMNFVLIFVAAGFYGLTPALELLPTVAAALSGGLLVAVLVVQRRVLARLDLPV